MNHNWLIEDLNKPWEAFQYGPNSFDCWGYLHHAFKKAKGIDLPRFQYVDPSESKTVIETFRDNVDQNLWRKTYQPKDFCAVLMGRSKFPVHCGIYLNVDGGVIVHCSEGVGVNVVSLHNLYDRFQLKIFGFYVHKDLE